MPIEFPGTSYIKDLNNYYQPFSTPNLPYSLAAIVGIGTIGALGAIYLHKKNQKSLLKSATALVCSTLENAYDVRSTESLIQRLLGQKQIIYSGYNPFGEWHGFMTKETVFNTINAQLSENGQKKLKLTLNGIEYDGTDGKRAENIYAQMHQLLGIPEGHNEDLDKAILYIMLLLQESVFDPISKSIETNLHQHRHGFRLMPRESDPKCSLSGEYKLKVEKNSILLTCWRDQVLSKTYGESNSAMLKGPYAIIRGRVDFNLSKNTLEKSWQVEENLAKITLVEYLK